MASVTRQAISDYLTQGRTITELQTVAVWNNQYEQAQEGTDNIFFPSIYLERVFEPAVPMLMGVKQVDFLLNVHILHNQIDAGDGTLSQNLDVFELRDKVVRAFDKFKATGCGVLQYATEQEDFTHNNIYHYIVTFKAAMVDTTGTLWDNENGKWTEKDPPFDLEITKTIEPPYTKNLS